MLRTNQKSERCDRWNNEVITLPLTCNVFSNSAHLNNDTSLMDLGSISSTFVSVYLSLNFHMKYFSSSFLDRGF